MIDSNFSEDPPSKSQRKRDMLALQKLGETLTTLSLRELDKFPLSPRLRDAILEAHLIKSHEAKRRQLQYIGKIMRDEDTTLIEETLAKIQNKHQKDKTHFHQTERWRDKLIAEGDTALQAFFTRYPASDHPHLRQLMRNAQNSKKGASTELFRYLRQIIEEDL